MKNTVEFLEKIIKDMKKINYIDLDKPFMELGLDSKELVSISGKLEKEFQLELSPTVLLEYPTLRKLSSYLNNSIKKSKTALTNMKRKPQDSIVSIIGMSCRFPKAKELSEYIDVLEKGKDCISKISKERLKLTKWQDENYQNEIFYGGYLTDIDEFDASYFGLTEEEAVQTDPQQRLLLEEVVHALQDAGLTKQKMNCKKVGVFVGASNYDYSRKIVKPGQTISSIVGNSGSMLANRISYLFDFHGPSMTIDTACSSSLVAIYEAVNSLKSSNCDIAIAAGVNLILDLDINKALRNANMLSKSGRCHTFDSRADGYVRGEGIGVVVLQRKTEALSFGARVYADVLGGNVNQDGRSASLTAPNKNMQINVIEAALDHAGVCKKDIQYIETHGTGTELGDYMEVSAIDEALECNGRDQKNSLWIGAVKTNIGHLESAAGIAGFMKLALSIYYKKMFPNCGFEQENPKIGFDYRNMKVVQSLRDWTNKNRIGSISSFGFGGTNCHMVLGSNEADETELRKENEKKNLFVIPISAMSTKALLTQLKTVYAYLSQNEGVSLAELESALIYKSEQMPVRVCYIVEKREHLLEQMKETIETKCGIENVRNNKIAFLFSGQGTQWKGMGKSLLKFELFRKNFERCRQEFLELEHGDILRTIESEDMNSTYYAQPLLFSFQVALCETLKELGCKCMTVYGHSLGEVAAAYAGGALSLKQAAIIVHYRSIIMDKFTGLGKMLSVGLNEAETERLLDKKSSLSVAVINDEQMVVVAGDTADIENFKQKLDQKKIFNRYLPVNYAFHYKGLEPYVETLKENLGKVKTLPTRVKFISSTFGEYKTAKELDANYWAMNMRKQVRFSEASELARKDNNLILEIGASTALMPYLLKKQNIDVKFISCQKRNYDSLKSLYEALAQLYKLGCEIKWEQIIDEIKMKPFLPLYKFEKVKCWPNTELSSEIQTQRHTAQWNQKTIKNTIVKLLRKYVTSDIQIDEKTELNDLGMDSLKYFQFRSNIQEYFNVIIAMKDIISNHKVSDMVSIIMQQIDTSSYEKNDSIVKLDTADEIAGMVTDNQKAIIAAQVCNPQSSMFNMQGCWKILEELNDNLWADSYQKVINSHFIFKIRYCIENNSVRQNISGEECTIKRVYLTDSEDVKDYISKEANRPFDIQKEVINGQIIYDRAGNKYFFLSIHHVAIDGISMYLLLKEIIDVYGILKQKGVYHPITERKYLEYQREAAKKKTTEKYKKDICYWEQKLKGSSFAEKFPIVSAYDCKNTDKSGELFFRFDSDVNQGLEKLSRKFKISKFSVLYGIYQVLYYKLTGSDDFITCTYSSGRFEPGYMDLIGYTVQPVYMRTRVTEDTDIRNFLQNLNMELIEALERDISIYDLNSCMDAENGEDLNHVFVYEKLIENGNDNIYITEQDADINLCGMRVRAMKTKLNHAQYDLVFMAEECQDSVTIKLEYRERAYSRQSIQNLAFIYQYLVSQILENPNELLSGYLLTETSSISHMLLEGGLENGHMEGILYHQYLERFASLSPNKIAVQFRNETITYDQLNKKSNQIARMILGYTKGVKQPVAVCMKKSIDFLAAIFGVMKAGCCYIPLDCKYPLERLQYIIDDSNVECIILDGDGEKLNLKLDNCKHLNIKCTNKEKDTDLNLKIELEDLAYIIYTSGSTGRPKGVKLAHRGIENVVQEQGRIFHVNAQDHVSFFASVSFDASVFEILMGIGHGAMLCFDEAERMGTGETMRCFLETFHITITTLPSSVLESMDNKELSQLRVIVTAGEPCSQEIKNKWVPGHEFYNAYGVTEATIWNTTSKCQYGNKVYIGNCVANHNLYILNHEKKVCPKGVIGELYIGGIGVSKGYIGLEQENKERFAPLWDSDKIFYKTGDLVREDYNGEIEYVGRIDNQVKIRGFRIELEEIEKVLQSFQKINSAIAVVSMDAGKEQLFAFIKLKNAQQEKEEVIEETKQYLIKYLPHYMIPDRIIIIQEWKLTSNGKIDRNAMLQEEQKNFSNRVIVKGSNQYEIELCNYVGKLLGKEVSIDDRVLFIGVNSIMAYDILSYIREKFKVGLDFNFIMRNPSLYEIAGEIAGAKKEVFKPAEENKKEIKYQIQKKQRGIWFSCHINKKSTEFNIPVVLKIEGDIDKECCRKAFEIISQKHNILRTQYQYHQEDGEVWGTVKNELEIPLKFEDMSGLNEKDKNDLLIHRIREMQNLIFNVEKIPLYRILVVKYTEKISYMMVTIHHLIADGWSVNILLDEFRTYYSQAMKGESDFTILEYQYEDYIKDQKDAEKNVNNEKEEQYWIEKLNYGECKIHLPGSKSRPEVMTHEGGNLEVNFDKDYLDLLKVSARNNEITVSALMLAAYAVLLRNYTGQEDIVIGTPDVGRKSTEEKKLIGMFLDTLVLKINVNDNKKIREYLKEAFDELLESHSHNKTGLDKIVELVNPPRDLSSTPIIQVMFNMINFTTNLSEIAGMPIEAITNDNLYAKYDLTLYVTEYKDKINLRLNYYAGAFEEQYMAGFLENYKKILSYMIQNQDSKIEGCRSADTDSNKLTLPLNYIENNDLLMGFRKNLSGNPERLAVKYGDKKWNYRELEVAVEEIREQVRKQNIQEGECVAVISTRIPMLIAAILAVISEQGSFVIIDNKEPEERKKVIMEVNDATLEMQIDGEKIEIERIKSAGNKNKPGYRIMTSGTTGEPKCIIGNNSAVNHFVQWEAEKYSMKADERVSFLSGVTHDPVLRDIFVPLYLGAAIIIPNKDKVIENNLYMYFKENDITVSHMTPSIAEILLIHADSYEKPLSNVKYIFLGGEILKKNLAVRLQKLCPNARIVNYYGASETPQAMTYFEFKFDDKDNLPEKLPLGKAIDDVQVVILNKDKTVADKGNIGEIAIRTPYLSKGYFKNESQNNARFIQNPFFNQKEDMIYLTGDYGMKDAEGNIHILGREDKEVKILGQRVNLEEIEGIMQKYDKILACKVVLYKNSLFAFVIPGNNYKEESLKEFLLKKCPDYMIPAKFFELEHFPVTANGKVDQNWFYRFIKNRSSRGEKEDNSLTERRIKDIWLNILQCSSIAKTEKFFEVGGNSLKAVMMQKELVKEFQMDIDIIDIFKYPTIQSLAEFMDEKKKDSEFKEKSDSKMENKIRGNKMRDAYKKISMKRG